MMGVSVYGDAATISSMAGETDTKLTFTADTMTFGGEEMPYTVDANGAAVTAGELSMPIMALGDDIIMDMSGFIGMDMVMMFSK